MVVLSTNQRSFFITYLDFSDMMCITKSQPLIESCHLLTQEKVYVIIWHAEYIYEIWYEYLNLCYNNN